MSVAGYRRHKLTFQQRNVQPDGYGNEETTAFFDRFTRWGQVKPSLGIETVNAARLAGQQPVDIVVLRDSETKTIGTDWQIVDAISGAVYAITAPAIDMQDDRKYLTMKAVQGRAS